MSFLKKVQGMRLVKVATLYAAISWAMISIADVFFPILKLPDWSLTALVVIAITGFPLALLVAWIYDISKHKHKALNTEAEYQVTAKTRAIEFSCIFMIAIGVLVFYLSGKSDEVLFAEAEPQVVTPAELDAESDTKSVAVLPFASFSDQAEDVNFALGLSEELLNVLAQNEKLRVAARTSSFEYQNTNINIRTIAGRLGVEYVLEGSVRRSGDTVRITAQLIQALDGSHVFSKSWDRPFNDVFKIQDEIANSVLENFQLSLLKPDQMVASRTTDDLEAFAAYSKARVELRKRTSESLAEAIDYFQRAVDEDPEFTLAYVGLATAHILSAEYSGTSIEKARELATPFLQQAMVLDPDGAEVLATRGLMAWLNNYDTIEGTMTALDEASDFFQRAIDANPNYAQAVAWYGTVAKQQGKFDKAMKLHQRAYELDPMNSVASLNWALDLVSLGRYDEAMEINKVMNRHNPDYPGTYAVPAVVYNMVGQLPKAHQWYLESIKRGQKSNQLSLFGVYLDVGAFEQAGGVLEKVKLEAEDMNANLGEMQIRYLLAQGKYQEMRDAAKEMFATETETSVYNHFVNGIASLGLGDIDDATINLQQASDMLSKPGYENLRANIGSLVYLHLAKAQQLAGDQLAAENALTLAEELVEEKQAMGANVPGLTFDRSTIKILRGKTLEGFSLLKTAVGQGLTSSWILKQSPVFDGIRGDDFFKDLIRKMDSKNERMREKILEQLNRVASA